MILDTSAIVAIVAAEPEAEAFTRAIEESPSVAISAGTVIEASLVLGTHRGHILDTFLRLARARVIPVDEPQVVAARQAHARYGRGSGSPARLNFGDCFSYALARTTGEPLLYKGRDFIHTDVTPAVRAHHDEDDAPG